MSTLVFHRKPHRAGGFTLIEMMIVVAVVAILAAIAYPSYNDAVRKGRRGQAKADLLEAVQLAERFRTVNGTYQGFVLPAAYAVSPREGTARYNVGFQGAAGNFTLTADPISGAGQEEDTKCLALSITQAGVKDASGSNPGDCW